MTINQALDQLTNGQKLNKEQEALKVSLNNTKHSFGGKTVIENSAQVQGIITFGNKEGIKDKA